MEQFFVLWWPFVRFIVSNHILVVFDCHHCFVYHILGQLGTLEFIFLACGAEWALELFELWFHYATAVMEYPAAGLASLDAGALAANVLVGVRINEFIQFCTFYVDKGIVWDIGVVVAEIAWFRKLVWVDQRVANITHHRVNIFLML